jgi:hypothetical protein
VILQKSEYVLNCLFKRYIHFLFIKLYLKNTYLCICKNFFFYKIKKKAITLLILLFVFMSPVPQQICNILILQSSGHKAIVQDTCRTGVWLGRHICYNETQVSQGQLRENRNLTLSIRAKAVLIYVLSVPVHNVI